MSLVKSDVGGRVRKDFAVEFDAFCVSAHPRLVAALTHIVGDRPLAEDLAQEALIRAFKRWARVRQLRSPVGWTVHVGSNLARSAMRRRLVQRRVHQRLGSDQVHHDHDVALRLSFEQALATLTTGQREIVVLRYYVGLSATEIGDVLAMDPNAVRQAAHRGVAALRRSMVDADGPEELARET